MAWLKKLLKILVFCIVCRVCRCSYYCPTNCTCNDYTVSAGSNATNATTDGFTVDCKHRNDTDIQLLFADIESLLSNRIDNGIKVLEISNTILTDLPRSVCRMTSLTHCYISYNRLLRLPDNCFIKMKSLVSLQASNNQISELQDGLFDGLQRLREIKIDHNQITSIGLRLFSNASDLSSLRRIDLEQNRLTSLEPWPLIRGLAGSGKSIVDIDISKNRISTGMNSINWTFNCGMKVYLSLDLRDNNISHFTDIPRQMGLKYVDYTCLLNFRQLPNGASKPQSSINLQGNPIVCDCVDFELYRVESLWQYSHIFANMYCSLPEILYNLEIPRIPLREFVCDMAENCPTGCQCFSRPADASVNVNCTAANITSLPEKLPARPKSYTKYRLAFNNNRFLSVLEPRAYFENSYEFDARRAGIQNIDHIVWTSLTSITNLSLRENSLKYLPQSIVDVNISSLSIDIGGNPWHCSCENRWMTTWLKSIEKKLKNPSDLQCATPTRLRGKNMMTMTDSDYCYVPPKDTKPIIIALSTISGFIVLVIIVFIAVYRLRMLLFARWKVHPFDRDECEGEEMDYDVFLCCSSEDHNTHGQRILRQLESQNYRVCYHLRDFVGGVEIQENILASIQRSKRTVCLVTENFLHSAYCMHEFVVAVNLNMTTGHHRRLIILMALNNIAADLSETEGNIVVLRQYLRHYTYIDYRRYDWLTRLRYALPLKPFKCSNEHCALDAADDDEQMLMI